MINSFLDFLTEKTIHYFDMDDTLSHATDLIHVNNKHGERVRSISSKEFVGKKYPKLKKGESYDFSEFRQSDTYKVKPIRPMLGKLKSLHNKGKKVEILTARTDFDSQPVFAKKWKHVGIDINKVHVRRAGNLGLKAALGKAAMIHASIKKHKYKVVHLYDDSLDNIHAMLVLKKQHPKVKFYGHHVQHTPKGIHITRYKA